MFGLGAYMGQGANQSDLNDNWHIVSRFTYPWKTASGQIYEAGIQAYTGNYVRSENAIYRRPGGAGAFGGALGPSVAPGTHPDGRRGFDDDRVAVSFRMYPQPWGLEGEWNWGHTPGLDIAENMVKNKSLHGGYVQGSYFANDVRFMDMHVGNLIPFVKWQYYDGYNKAEINAAPNKVNDWELGVEWQIAPEVELVAVYHKMKRSNLGNRGDYTQEVGSYATFDAEALRLQLQYNFF